VDAVFEILKSATDEKAGLAQACRVIAQTREGVERLITEMLHGDSDSWWRGIERGHGKAPMVVEVDNRHQFSLNIEGASPLVLDIVMAMFNDHGKEAKVDAIEATAEEVAVQRVISSTSGKASYVNSDDAKQPVTRPRF